MLNLSVFTFHGSISPPPVIEDVATPAGLGNFIQAIISLLIIVAFIASFVMLLISGIQWSTSGGDEKAVASARGRATAAIIGLVLTLSAFAIIRLIEEVLGARILTGPAGIELPGL